MAIFEIFSRVGRSQNIFRKMTIFEIFSQVTKYFSKNGHFWNIFPGHKVFFEKWPFLKYFPGHKVFFRKMAIFEIFSRVGRSQNIFRKMTIFEIFSQVTKYFSKNGHFWNIFPGHKIFFEKKYFCIVKKTYIQRKTYKNRVIGREILRSIDRKKTY